MTQEHVVNKEVYRIRRACSRNSLRFDVFRRVINQDDRVAFVVGCERKRTTQVNSATMKRFFGFWIDRKKMSKRLLVATLSRLAVWALGDVPRDVSLHSFPVESFGDSVVSARFSHVTTRHFIMEGLKRF